MKNYIIEILTERRPIICHEKQANVSELMLAAKKIKPIKIKS